MSEIELYTEKETEYLIEYYKEKVIGKVYLGNMRIMEFQPKHTNNGKVNLYLLTSMRSQSNIHSEVSIKSVSEHLNLKSPRQILSKKGF